MLACRMENGKFAVTLRPAEAGTSAKADGEPTLSRHYVESFFGRPLAWRLMVSAGLCAGAEAAVPSLVSPAEFWTLCLLNLNEAHDENHGCTRRSMPRLSWGMVFSSVNQMDTVGSGLRRLVELAPIIGSGLTISLVYSPASVRLSFLVADDVDDVERAERYTDLIALVFHCMLLWGTNNRIRPRRVRLSGLLDPADGSMAQLLASDCHRSGRGTTITYDRGDMALPLGARRYKMSGVHETMMFLDLSRQRGIEASIPDEDAGSIVVRVRRVLATDGVSQQQAASRFGMSVATLQRRLAESGHSFRGISREIRVEKLRSLLATQSNLDDIAVELGFSERRSLWRACHDWLGMSPADYRRVLRLGSNG